MTLRTGNWKRLLAGVLIAVLLGFLFLNSPSIDHVRNTRVITALGKLPKLDAQMDEFVLKHRFGLLNNYDPLVVTLESIKQIKHDLEHGEYAIVGLGIPEIDQAMVRFSGRLAEKEAVLERFKSRNAVLRNSSHYFPLAVDKLSRDSQVSEALKAQAESLLRQVLLLRNSATTGEYENVARALESLVEIQGRYPAQVGHMLQEVIQHAQQILSYQQEVNQLVMTITSAQKEPLGKNLTQSYTRSFERDLARANVYRLLLILSSIALLAYAVDSFLRLRENAVRLKGIMETQAREITGRKEAEQELRRTEERYRQLVELSPEAIFIQTGSRLVFCNIACARLFGAIVVSELVGKETFDLFRPVGDTAPQRGCRITEIGQTNSLIEMQIVRLDGAAVDVEVTAGSLIHDGKPAMQVVLRDITERKKSAERLAHLAQYDTLTGLPNRNLFHDRLSLAVAKAKRGGQMLALMFIDLDRFKEINDTLGHAIGDKVLRTASRLLKESLREVDTVARIGGDEFTVILENITDIDHVTAIAEKIKQALAVPIITEEGHDVFITTSMGITLYPLDADNIDSLLQTADVAMYHAKEEGRNTYEFYAPELNAQAAGHLKMDGLLRRALERQEFVVHYQPKVDVQSGRITGMEALIRWNSNELGLVSPGQFIPVAEKSGLIVPIGEWVLRTACAQNKAFQDQGFPSLSVSVNLSPRQFREKNLVEMIAGVLAETGLEPRFLDLEITEGMVMHDTERAIALLKRLRQLGIQLSVDDFGTGYSSLAYLKRFPVQSLKIDQSFVRDLSLAGDDAGIVKAIIAMADSLKLGVIAEGVETREQLACLANLGCGEYQGFYFSRPVPAADFVLILRRDRSSAEDVRNAAAQMQKAEKNTSAPSLLRAPRKLDAVAP
jgi:diguanylate cyclase (GGDEF)-like protein/PAS domain S-box-containing protein